MNDNVTQTSMFGTEKIYKILLRLAPPVMFAQLIQALYNIVDSYFVGKYSPRRADCPLRDLSGTAYHHGARGRNRCRRQHADGAAVTVLGLYYKMQTFFFIPLLGLQTCIVPVLSYNYAAKKYKRCQTILNESVLFSMLFMLIGVFCFELLPGTLLGLFSHDPDVFSLGIPAFRIIGLSFLPAVVSLLSLIRQLGCLIPIFFALSKIGLSYTWIAFPASEIITGVIGVSLYLRQVRQWAGGVD